MKSREDLVVFDLEVSPNYFLCGFKKLDGGKILQIDTQTTLTRDQRMKIKKVLRNVTVIGFNSMRYDIPMLLKALEGTCTMDLFKMSKTIIEENLPQFMTMNRFDIDQMEGLDHIDISEPSPGVFVSLKGYGARLHSTKLQDLPYAYDKVLTSDEIEVIKNYNINDLDTTIDLYRAIEPRIKLREEMSKKYGLDLRSKSDAQIAEVVIVSELKNVGVIATKPKMPKTINYTAPDCISFKTPELQELLQGVTSTTFTINQKNGQPVLPDWLKKNKLIIGGTQYQVGVGGLHSKEKKLVCEPTGENVMRNIDVASYYPSMILEFGFYPPRFTEKFLDVYGSIYKTRLKAKKEKNMVVSDGLKIVLNGSFGKLGSMYSKLYAPDLMLQVTLTGQLMLLMLIEELTEKGFTVVSSNTDGIELPVATDRLDELEAIVFDWELKTGMDMEHGQYKALYARDVNNYVAVYDGYAKAKGVYAEPTLSKNSEYPIVFKAIRDYLLNGTPMMDTLTACKDVRQFLTARTVKGGGVWSKPIVNTPEFIQWNKNNQEAYGYQGGDIPKDVVEANDKFRQQQMKEEGIYLGKVVRWYYAINGMSIHYKTNGNKVPKSDFAMPYMDLGVARNPDGMYAVPDDLNYEHYRILAEKHLEELGVTNESE
jgi:hypothetical protein